MTSLLVKPVVPTLHQRRLFDRRQNLPSFADIYRWYSGIAIKLVGVSIVALLAARWQSTPQIPNTGASSGVAVYHWHGFHRVGSTHTNDRGR